MIFPLSLGPRQYLLLGLTLWFGGSVGMNPIMKASRPYKSREVARGHHREIATCRASTGDKCCAKVGQSKSQPRSGDSTCHFLLSQSNSHLVKSSGLLTFLTIDPSRACGSCATLRLRDMSDVLNLRHHCCRTFPGAFSRSLSVFYKCRSMENLLIPTNSLSLSPIALLSLPTLLVFYLLQSSSLSSEMARTCIDVVDTGSRTMVSGSSLPLLLASGDEHRT